MTWNKTYIRLIEFKRGVPKYKQLALAIAEDIQQGKISKGDLLPTVSEYGSLNKISTSTVGRAYEFLAKKGITENKTGIGCTVIKEDVSKILYN